jgi:hypothetical protein
MDASRVDPMGTCQLMDFQLGLTGVGKDVALLSVFGQNSRIVGSEFLEGHDCWVLETENSTQLIEAQVPRYPEATRNQIREQLMQISRIRSWVGKQDLIQWRMESYNQQGGMIVSLAMISVQPNRGLTPEKLQMKVPKGTTWVDVTELMAQGTPLNAIQTTPQGAVPAPAAIPPQQPLPPQQPMMQQPMPQQPMMQQPMPAQQQMMMAPPAQQQVMQQPMPMAQPQGQPLPAGQSWPTLGAPAIPQQPMMQQPLPQQQPMMMQQQIPQSVPYPMVAPQSMQLPQQQQIPQQQMMMMQAPPQGYPQQMQQQPYPMTQQQGSMYLPQQQQGMAGSAGQPIKIQMTPEQFQQMQQQPQQPQQQQGGGGFFNRLFGGGQ